MKLVLPNRSWNRVDKGQLHKIRIVAVLLTKEVDLLYIICILVNMRCGDKHSRRHGQPSGTHLVGHIHVSNQFGIRRHSHFPGVQLAKFTSNGAGKHVTVSLQVSTIQWNFSPIECLIEVLNEGDKLPRLTTFTEIKVTIHCSFVPKGPTVTTVAWILFSCAEKSVIYSLIPSLRYRYLD